MHFEVTQRIPAAIADVADAFCDPGYYASLAAAPKLGTPEVLGRQVDGALVTMRVRYRFAGDLSSAARAVLDPAKLTWVEESVHDLDGKQVSFVLQPDHYADRFSASGRYRFEADGDHATVRQAEGDVKVRAPLVGSTVERAIVSGLKEHLDAEVALITAFIAG